MAIADVKKRLKQKLCTRDLESGDLVKVTEGARWKEWDHKIGGRGHWAVFVKKKGEKFIVRPLTQDGITQNEHEVGNVAHLEDVIQVAATREYLNKRGVPVD